MPATSDINLYRDVDEWKQGHYVSGGEEDRVYVFIVSSVPWSYLGNALIYYLMTESSNIFHYIKGNIIEKSHKLPESIKNVKN